MTTAAGAEILGVSARQIVPRPRTKPGKSAIQLAIDDINAKAV